MDNEVEKYETEKIELPVLENKIKKLGETLLSNSTDDRNEARKVKQLIEQEIAEIKNEYDIACAEYRLKVQEAETFEDPVQMKHELSKIWKPKRPQIALLISELNKALDVGISSSDNIVKLLEVLTKIKLRNKSNPEFDDIELSKKRVQFLKEEVE